MGKQTYLRRRWLGAAFLVAALVMLVAGETGLRDRLGGLGFLVFWGICFGFTCLAVAIAFLDAAATRRRARDEQRAFLEKTLQEIARKQKAKKPE